ncbi:MAG: hypothetical protein RI957_1657 [Verrucomicrobiota bacterium]|jgi:hypothetical protein
MPRSKATVIPAVMVDEIPTNPSSFKAAVVAIAVASLAGLFSSVYGWLPSALENFLSRNAEIHILFQSHGIDSSLRLVFHFAGLVAILAAIAGAAGFYRHRITWHILRLPLLATYLLVAFYLWVTWNAYAEIVSREVSFNGSKQDKVTLLRFWWSVAWPALAMAAFAGWNHVMLRSRSVFSAFTQELGPAMPGDIFLEDLRTHGREPHQRRSLYLSTFTHFAILILIPWILSLGGCVEAYKVPKGSGEPVVAIVKMVKPKKKKKQTLTLRPNSAILYEQPDLDDTQVDQQMEEQTQATYAANNAKAGKMGKGGGKEGGWPEGMENYKIRFIRLEHSGTGWDDGMDASNADVNFLRAFAETTGFKKIANSGESHSIALLKKYPKDGFPPFVFLTGNGSIGNVSEADKKILREYCLNGGMLIADAGSVSFHQSFMYFIRSVFPDKPLIDIADDDMLYQVPFAFPNGAPPFWRLGGTRALGIKHEGRWIAFYHPGDMNGAWKSPGYTDVTPDMRDAAMNLGVNLLYYSFNQWNDAISKQK